MIYFNKITVRNATGKCIKTFSPSPHIQQCVTCHLSVNFNIHTSTVFYSGRHVTLVKEFQPNSYIHKRKFCLNDI